MVEQAHVDQRQGLLQPRGDGAVGGAGFGIAAGMVVADYQRGGIVRKRAAHDFARVHFGAIDGAVEQLLERECAVARVERPHTAKRTPRLAICSIVTFPLRSASP